MKRTYTRTMTVKNLKEATVKLFVGDKKVEYTGVIAWDIIEGGKEAEEIEACTDESGIDENHTYLVLHFENGETSTFRNSHVDMFIR